MEEKDGSWLQVQCLTIRTELAAVLIKGLYRWDPPLVFLGYVYEIAPEPIFRTPKHLIKVKRGEKRRNEKHVNGEKERAQEEEKHPHPPLSSPLPERFEKLVSTWHSGSKNKAAGPQSGKRKGQSQASEGLTGAAGAQRRVPPAAAPSGPGASAVSRSDLSDPGWGAAVQGGPRSPSGLAGELGPDSPAAAAGVATRGPRSR